MIVRAWMEWATLAILAGGLSASAKPLDLPDKSTVNGRATPPMTQEFFLPGPLPSTLETPEGFRQSDSPNLAPPVADPAWNRLLLWIIRPI